MERFPLQLGVVLVFVTFYLMASQRGVALIYEKLEFEKKSVFFVN